jgi:hypothetical protein
MASQDGKFRTRTRADDAGRDIKQQADGRTDLSADLSADLSPKALATGEALAKVDAGRKAEDRAARAADTAQKRLADATRKGEQRRDRHRKEQLRRDFNRQGEDRKAAEQKQAAAKLEAQKRAAEQKEQNRADERKAAATQEARKYAAGQKAAARARSADQVREDFKRQNGDLMDGQKQQLSALSKQRTRERDSFADNRDEAIRHHAGRIQEIDGREKQAAIALAKQHDSLAGRLSAVTKKGRDRQEQERQGLAEKFESQRMTQHRDLAARQERQGENEQKARLRHGLEFKAMREGHVAARREQSHWQDNNRNRLVKERVSAEREPLAREFNRGVQEQALTRAFNPTPSGFPVPKHRQQQPQQQEQQKAQDRDPPALTLSR